MNFNRTSIEIYSTNTVQKRDIFQHQQTPESYAELLEPNQIPSSVMFAVICSLVLTRLQIVS